jgi:hypothetical protein
VLCLLGCGEEDLSRFASLPETGSARSMILAFAPVDGPVRIFARDTESSRAWEIPVEAASDAAMFAGLYSCPLQDLGLSDGEQPPLANGAGFFIPEASAGFVASVHAGTAEPWTQSDEAIAELSKLRVGLDPGQICAEFELDGYTLNSDREVVQLASLYDGSVLALTAGSKVFRLTPDGASEIDLPETTPWSRAVQGPAGWVYLLAPQTGHFLRTRLDGSPAELLASTTTTSHRQRSSLIASDSDAPFEIFATFNNQALERFDGTVWENKVLRRFEVELMTFQTLAWIARNEVLALGLGSDPARGVVHYEDGQIRQKLLESRDEGRTRSILHTENLGTLVGTVSGTLYSYDRARGSWRYLFGDSAISLGVRILHPLDEGVLFGGGAGALRQYHPWLSRACPERVYAGSTKLDYSAIFPGGFMLATPAEVPPRIHVLTQVEARKPCQEDVDL